MATPEPAARHATRALHAIHALGTLALLASGLLIQWPELRSWVVGGYGSAIARVHLWIGWAYLAAPALLLVVVAEPLRAELAQRLARSVRRSWASAHLLFTLAATALLGVSGILLLLDDWLPLHAWYAARSVHAWATWAVAATLLLHLVIAGRARAARERTQI